MLADKFNDAIGEPCPTAIGVGIGLVGADGQGSIQKENTALSPFGQVAAVRLGDI